jgi:predicted secreted protein
MTITAALVLFAVLWFVTLFVVLPIGLRTQDEEGEIAPGTPASAPAAPELRRKFFWVTVIAFTLWAALCAFILWGGVGVRDLDIWGRM